MYLTVSAVGKVRTAWITAGVFTLFRHCNIPQGICQATSMLRREDSSQILRLLSACKRSYASCNRGSSGNGEAYTALGHQRLRVHLSDEHDELRNQMPRP